MIKAILMCIVIVLCTQISSWAGAYEQCIMNNLEKANNEAAVNLLKEVCATIAKESKSPCESKPTSELTDQELCNCLGLIYDVESKKCK